MKTPPKMCFLTKIVGKKTSKFHRFLQNHGSLTDKFTPDKNDGTGTRFSFPLKDNSVTFLLDNSLLNFGVV